MRESSEPEEEFQRRKGWLPSLFFMTKSQIWVGFRLLMLSYVIPIGGQLFLTIAFSHRLPPEKENLKIWSNN